MYRVLLVEDQRMARTLIENMIAEEEDFELVASLANAAYAELACMQHRVDLVLMDIYTELGTSGLDAAARIKSRFPHIKVILLTSLAEYSFIERAHAAGAESFWYKNLSDESLISVMRRTMAGESIYPDKTPTVRLGNAVSTEFTARELEVLRLVVEGETDAAIADILGVSTSAVRFHINNMLQKTGYSSRTRLAVAAVNQPLVVAGLGGV